MYVNRLYLCRVDCFISVNLIKFAFTIWNFKYFTFKYLLIFEVSIDQNLKKKFSNRKFK